MTLLNNLAAWSYALSWTMIDSLWQFLIIALVLRLIFIVVSNYQAVLRYHLSLAALLLCAGWWLSNLSFYYIEFQSNSEKTIVAAKSMQPVSNNIEFGNHPVISPNPETLTIQPNESTTKASSKNAFHIAFIRWINQHKEWFFLLWGLGVAFLTTRFLRSWFQLKMLRTSGLTPVEKAWKLKIESLQQKMGINKKVRLILSSLVDEPITFGHFKPIILIPIGLINALSEKEVEAILLHELAHIRRYDFLINIFQSCLEIVLFYHPIIYWLNRVIRENREACCDDLAISIQKDEQLYAATLLHIQKYSLNIQNSLVMTAIGKKGAFTQRIHRLFNPKLTQKRSSFSLPFMVLFLILGSFIFLAFQNIRTQPAVSISADKMKIFYYGVENPITIAVEGIFNDEVKVTSKNLILRDLGDGKYSVIPLKIGKATIIVETSNMKKELEFEVQKFPTPNVANIKRSFYKNISVEEMRTMKRIEIDNLLNFDVACKVVSFEITRVPAKNDPITELSNRPTFAGRSLRLIKSAGKGDVYYVDNLKVKCPGDEKPRNIGGIEFRVK